MWRLCSKIYFIGNSFWKFYEVRSERGDFNSCGKWSSRVPALMLWWSLAWFPYFYSDWLWFELYIFGHCPLPKFGIKPKQNWPNFRKQQRFKLLISYSKKINMYHSEATTLATFITRSYNSSSSSSVKKKSRDLDFETEWCTSQLNFSTDSIRIGNMGPPTCVQTRHSWKRCLSVSSS